MNVRILYAGPRVAPFASPGDIVTDKQLADAGISAAELVQRGDAEETKDKPSSAKAG